MKIPESVGYPLELSDARVSGPGGAIAALAAPIINTLEALPADATPSDEFMRFRDFSSKLARPFRELRVWWRRKVHGADLFGPPSDQKPDLAQRLYKALNANPQLDVLAPPKHSILAFAVAEKPGESPDSRNARSKQLLGLAKQKNRVHLSGTELNEQFALRVAVGVHRAHQPHIDSLLADLQAAIEKLEEDNLNE